MATFEELKEVVRADLDEVKSYKQYNYVTGRINEFGGLCVCYVWEVEDPESKESLLPPGTTPASTNNVLGWDYGTYGTYVSIEDREEDIKEIIDKLV